VSPHQIARAKSAASALTARSEAWLIQSAPHFFMTLARAQLPDARRLHA
jgi:hypothetical protein